MASAFEKLTVHWEKQIHKVPRERDVVIPSRKQVHCRSTEKKAVSGLCGALMDVAVI